MLPDTMSPTAEPISQNIIEPVLGFCILRISGEMQACACIDPYDINALRSHLILVNCCFLEFFFLNILK